MSGDIDPTVGRVVHYVPDVDECQELATSPGEVLAAHIATVWSTHCVNLMVIDGNGNPHSRTSVPLRQPSDPVPNADGFYCQWMPYQMGQAAKTEELQREVDGRE